MSNNGTAVGAEIDDHDVDAALIAELLQLALHVA